MCRRNNSNWHCYMTTNSVLLSQWSLSLSVVKRRRLFLTERRNVNKPNKVIQQKQWPRHLGVILDSAIVILLKKKKKKKKILVDSLLAITIINKAQRQQNVALLWNHFSNSKYNKKKKHVYYLWGKLSQCETFTKRKHRQKIYYLSNDN